MGENIGCRQEPLRVNLALESVIMSLELLLASIKLSHRVCYFLSHTNIVVDNSWLWPLGSSHSYGIQRRRRSVSTKD